MLGFLLDVVVEKEGAAAFGSLSHYSSFLGLKPFIMKSFSVANFLSKCFHIKLTNKILNTKSLVSSLLFFLLWHTFNFQSHSTKMNYGLKLKNLNRHLSITSEMKNCTLKNLQLQQKIVMFFRHYFNCFVKKLYPRKRGF